MGGNRANSGDRRSDIRREPVGRIPVSAGINPGGGPETSPRSASAEDGEEAFCGSPSAGTRHDTTASQRDIVKRKVEPPQGDPIGNPGSDDAFAANGGTNAASAPLPGCPGSATTGLDVDPRMRTASDITAIILTGGRSTRFGSDKASTKIAGATLLDHVLADIDPSVPVVVVGPDPERAARSTPPSRSQSKTHEQEPSPEQLSRSLIVTREDPPGGGPVAGVLAGLEVVTTPICCVIATDMPTSAAIALDLATEHVRQFRSSSTAAIHVQAERSEGRPGAGRPSEAQHRQSPAAALARARAKSGPAWDGDDASVQLDASGQTQPSFHGPPGSNVPEALIPIDAAGHAQPLCGSYSTAALRKVAATLGSGNGASFRDILKLLRVREVQLDSRDLPKLFDIDTRHDLARTRQAIMAHVGGRFSLPETGGTNMLNDWAVAAASELGLDTEVDVEVILDVAKEAAHGVARPAAPLTTFLLGYAVAKGVDLQEAAAKLNALAENWPQNQE